MAQFQNLPIDQCCKYANESPFACGIDSLKQKPVIAKRANVGQLQVIFFWFLIRYSMFRVLYTSSFTVLLYASVSFFCSSKGTEAYS